MYVQATLDDCLAVISRPEARAERTGHLERVESDHRRLYRVAAEG